MYLSTDATIGTDHRSFSLSSGDTSAFYAAIFTTEIMSNYLKPLA